MSNEPQPVQRYDTEIEKRRIESDETIRKAAQEGWQEVAKEVANNVVEACKSGLLRNKEIEAKKFFGILVVVVLFFLGAGFLTWQKILPGEGFTFLIGTIVGYLISSQIHLPIGK